MLKRARKKGAAFELYIADKFKKLGYDCTTSRFESKKRDDLGVDLCGIPINVQAKAVERLSPSYHEILANMPDDAPNVIFHKRNHKGVVVAIPEDFFWKLYKKYYGLK